MLHKKEHRKKAQASSLDDKDAIFQQK